MQRSDRNNSITKQTPAAAVFNDDDVVVNGQDDGFAMVNALVPKPPVVDNDFEVLGAKGPQYPQTPGEFTAGMTEKVATDLSSLATEVGCALNRATNLLGAAAGIIVADSDETTHNTDAYLSGLFYGFAASTGGSLMSLAEKAKTATINALTTAEVLEDVGQETARPKSP